MRFQILSHAGLSVTGSGVTLVCDPWLVGSTYWRSWWNYPPVPRDVLRSLRPDFVYLTHIHWDHFQGVSLRRFGLQTPILIPRTPDLRMRRDLENMGFEDVREIAHGESLQLAPDFRITSYHFHVFLDSALVIETEGRVLFNANDCKVMGGPLRQILDRHPHFDFVFRSHSSANSRLCYEILDDPAALVDDPTSYVRDFTEFAKAVGAEYAIPFASNSCYLHDETFRFNDKGTTPEMVREYYEASGTTRPRLQVMVAGDAWSEEGGFDLSDHDWFEHRESHLERYREEVKEKLEATAEKEAKATVTKEHLERYFSKAFAAMPWAWRRLYKGSPILYVLTAGENRWLFEVDFWRKQVREVESYDDRTHPLQVHTGALVMKHCMAVNLFTHLAISKRVRYRVRSDAKRKMMLLNLFFNCYEYGMLPLRRMASPRFVGAWLRRWRELLLWARIGVDVALRRGFHFPRYLPPARPLSLPG